MTTERLLPRLVFAGALGIALFACNGSGGKTGGTGGTSVSASGGSVSTGGVTGGGSGGAPTPSGGAMSGGAMSTGGDGGTSAPASGGSAMDAAVANGGATATGGSEAKGGNGADAASASGGGKIDGMDAAVAGDGATATGGAFTGTCTQSKATGTKASGSGPHKVIVETNADPGIDEGTIFRPADLGGTEKYPIFVWGQGACSLNGLANAAAMAEIASHGYFVVADGTPNGSGGRTMDRSKLAAMGAPLIAYIDWAIAENAKPCSAYYQSLDTTKIASNGFSCGGLMSQATVMDPRITTWGVTSSGMAGADKSFYDMVHTPVFFVEGGPSDMAYDGALEGYQAISKLDVPVMWFSKDIGHGGDLTGAGGGDFTKLNLAWLNWWLKGDLTATGKGRLVGAGCTFCGDSAWEVMSAKIP